MNQKKLSIDSYLNKVIQESLQKVRQRKTLREADDLFGEEPKTAEPEKDKEASGSDDEAEKLKKGEVAVEDVVEKLNTIRSGKSFKDPEISKNLEEYVNSMSKAEKTALFAFLKGISQIVTGEISPEAAVEPSDKPVGVEMKKGSSVEKITVKTKLGGSISPTKKSQEDTSGPVPISPKKK